MSLLDFDSFLFLKPSNILTSHEGDREGEGSGGGSQLGRWLAALLMIMGRRHVAMIGGGLPVALLAVRTSQPPPWLSM